MKLLAAACAAAAWLSLPAPSAAFRASSRAAQGVQAQDRTITQVVKLLQGMLDKSKADGDTDRDLYAKYKCYCNENEAAKKEEIDRLTKDIGLLESDVQQLKADTGGLSEEVAQLKEDMAANVAARDAAQATRDEENKAFLALETDLTKAISSMDSAITFLADVGADQSMEQAAADHQKFTAGFGSATLLKLRSTVKQALLAASTIVTKKQSVSVESFLQAPFTGTYTSQSAEVIGILKDMRDTFKSNLEDATNTETAAVAAHHSFMVAKRQAHADMDGLYQSKQTTLSTNDNTLATKKGQLADSERQKGEAETFLGELRAMCKQKAEEYQERTMLRTTEEAAIAEAISILNSDTAFETFGTVTATKSGAVNLYQSGSVQKHLHGAQRHDVRRQQAQALLREVANSCKSMPLRKIAALLQAGNPFGVVLTQIEKMVKLIEEEEKADDERLQWCNTERTRSNEDLRTKTSQITTLGGEIDTLTRAIEEPDTGLKAMIQSDESALRTNSHNQKSETKSRTSDNLAYQQDIANLVKAEEMLREAVAVLRAYYARISGGDAPAAGSFEQQGARPAPPSTWTGSYKGQSEHGGSKAIDMLEFILSNTQKEEEVAHDAEKTSQHAFEDRMQQLKDEEASLQTSLTDLQKSLAEKESELMGKKEDLKATQGEKQSIEAYLEQIKPGCDFITTNIGQRKANRDQETTALLKASSLLKGTPAYQEAVAKAHTESLGDCKEACKPSEEHVDCKACLVHVTVPAYCAGHPGTPGC